MKVQKKTIAIIAVLFLSVKMCAGDNEAVYPFIAYPAGYELKRGPKESLRVIEIDGAKALQFKSAEVVLVRIRSPFFSLKPDTKYVLTFQVKIADLKTETGNWPDGIRVDVASTNPKVYRWTGISGNGNSEGWITAALPFDTAVAPELTKVRIMLYFMNMSGTISIRNLKIKAVDASVFPDGRRFRVGNKTVHAKILKL